jgi:hypothetical protein
MLVTMGETYASYIALERSMAIRKRTAVASSTPAPSSTPTTSAAAAGASAFSGEHREDIPESMAVIAATSPGEVDELRASILMNAEYHGCREGFLDTKHRWFMFGVIALGAAALIDALPDFFNRYRALFPAGAALLGALDLTFDLSNRARAHAMMRRRYFELLGELVSNHKTPKEVHVCLEQFSADEEPQYRALLLTCWNSAQRSVYGSEAKQFEIPGCYRLTKNCFRYSGADFGEPVAIAKSAVPSA